MHLQTGNTTRFRSDDKTQREKKHIFSSQPGVNDIMAQNLAQAPDLLLLTPLNLRKCFWGTDHRSQRVSICVLVCVNVSRCASGCHVAPSDSALLCQEIRTQGKPLAVPAYWISPLNRLCCKLQGCSISKVTILAENSIDFIFCT